MSICELDRRTPNVPSLSVRTLRWVFRRNEDVVVCELGLTGDDRAYALRIDPPWDATGRTTEIFDDVAAAFERHEMVERSLVQQGWSLENFESRQILRRRDDPSDQASEATG
jgi:hypothetical protein